jgi:hypothetical protein
MIKGGGGNYIDFEELQKEIVPDLKRLSRVRPHLVEEVRHLLE